MSYATVADFRQYLPQAPEDSATDALIAEVLTRATDIVAGAMGIRFFAVGEDWPAATVKRVFSESSVWLKLPAYQEGSITLLTEVGSATALTDWEELWGQGKLYLWREAGWGGRRYSVTAQWGYGPAPANIVEVTLECAVNLWRMRDRGMYQEVQTGPGTAGNGGGSVSALRFIGGLTSQQRAILAAERAAWRDGVS